MQLLGPIEHPVVIVAGILTSLAILVAFAKWLTAKVHTPKATSSSPQYDYCLTSCFKNRWSFYGYFGVYDPSGKLLPYRERYNALLPITLTEGPNRLAQLHVEALERLITQLKADGWEYLEQPDITLWYGHLFRRLKKA